MAFLFLLSIELPNPLALQDFFQNNRSYPHIQLMIVVLPTPPLLLKNVITFISLTPPTAKIHFLYEFFYFPL